MITFTRARKEDVPDIHSLLQSVLLSAYRTFMPEQTILSFLETRYSTEMLLKEAEDKTIFFGIAKDESGRIVGTQSAKKIEGGVLYLYRGYVLPEYRHQHIATTLIGQAIEVCSPVRCLRTTIYQKNKDALELFLRKGFSVAGQQEREIAGERYILLTLEKEHT